MASASADRTETERVSLTDDYVAANQARFTRLLKKCPRFIQDKDTYRQVMDGVLESADPYRVCYMGYHLMCVQKDRVREDFVPGDWEDEVDINALLHTE